MRSSGEKQSALAIFLSHEAVKAQLIKNIQTNPTMPLDGKLSRIFNNLPRDYCYVQPITETLAQSINEGRINVWFEFMFYFVLEDLFDDEYKLKKDIYDILNIKEEAEKSGCLDLIYNQQDSMSVNKLIFQSYIINIISPDCLNVLWEANESKRIYKILSTGIIDSNEENFLHTTFSREINGKIDSIIFEKNSLDTLKENFKSSVGNLPDYIKTKIFGYETRVKMFKTNDAMQDINAYAHLRYHIEPRRISSDAKSNITNGYLVSKEADIRENWIYHKGKNQDALFIDATRGRLFLIQGENYFGFAKEDFSKIILDVICGNNEDTYQELIQNYSQSISSYIGNAIFSAIINTTNNNFIVSFDKTERQFNLYRDKEGRIFFKTNFNKIALLNPDNNMRLFIPGKVRFRFILKSEGFELDSVDCSNKLLLNLCFKNKLDARWENINLETLALSENKEKKRTPSKKEVEEFKALQKQLDDLIAEPSSSFFSVQTITTSIRDSSQTTAVTDTESADSKENSNAEEKSVSEIEAKGSHSSTPRDDDIGSRDDGESSDEDPSQGQSAQDDLRVLQPIKSRPNFLQRNWGLIAIGAVSVLAIGGLIATSLLFPPLGAAITGGTLAGLKAIGLGGLASTLTSGTAMWMGIGLIAGVAGLMNGIALAGTAIVRKIRSASVALQEKKSPANKPGLLGKSSDSKISRGLSQGKSDRLLKRENKEAASSTNGIRQGTPTPGFMEPSHSSGKPPDKKKRKGKGKGNTQNRKDH